MVQGAAMKGIMMVHFDITQKQPKGMWEHIMNYHSCIGMGQLLKAAIRGHPFARHNLGCAGWKNDRHNRAIKHFS